MKTIINFLFFSFLLLNPALAQNAAILPQGKTQFLDNNGNPLSSGKVFFYIPSTTTFKTTWQDAAKTTPNTNPVILDAGGRAIIYGDGTYRQLVRTSANVTIFDAVTASAGTGGSTTGTGDGDLVGTVKSWAGLVAPNQYVFAYGQEISRITYAAFYTAVTLNQNVNCTSGSPILTGLSDTSQIPAGAVLETTCIAAGSTVLSKTSTTVTMNTNASLTTATTGVFFLYGNGNGSTTFNVPDLRGYVVAGRCNMGGTDCTNLTSTGLGVTASATGAKGGGQTKTLLASNLPPYTPAGNLGGNLTVGNGGISIGDPGHTHTLNNAGNLINSAAGTSFGGGGVGATVVVTNNVAVTGIDVVAHLGGGGTFTGTAQGGISTPFGIVQSTQTLNYIIKITPDQNSADASGVTSLGLMVGDIACGTGLLCTGNIISLAPTVTAPTITVATNAALKALGSGLYSWATRTGYYANGDSPSTIYYWDSGASCTDDGGSCIAPSVGSGRWILVKQARVPASIFGAVCDGSNDDTLELNNASIYVQSLTGPGNTLLLSGRCIISSSAINVQTNVSIEGDGANSTFIFPTTSTINCINFNPSSANKTLNVKNLTCSYPSLSTTGVVGIQYGNNTYNNIGGVIDSVNVTNGTSGINLLNSLNGTIKNSTVSPYYNYGVKVSNPLAPDSGGNIIRDNYFQVFAPITSNTIGLLWQSGGAFNLTNNQIFAPRPVYLNIGGQTSELHIHHNLLVGTGTPTASIQLDSVSASFTCTQSGTNMTVTGVTGTIVTGGVAALGQTVTGTGVAAGTTIASQTSGTPGGAGVYVTTLAGTAAAAACKSTFIMTELIIDGNINDNAPRALLVSSNTGGTFNYNMIYSNNAISSDNNSSTNSITINDSSGISVSNNLIKCNGTCTAGRALLLASTVDKVTIWQPTSSKIGTWGAADSIGSTNTCGMLGNALVTTC
jgi:hypothetical protein